MNEQLQNKIAIALDKMMNGAPELWERLIMEFQTQCIARAIIAGIIFFIGLIIFKHCFSKTTWAADSMKYEVPTIISSAVVAFSLLLCIEYSTDALAPSLELIQKIR